MVAADPGKFEAAAADALRECDFVLSAVKVSQLPRDSAREVAVAGRSNAGKSSVINALCGQAALARTSKTPGRTQALNCFRLAPARYLIDLPGYGYAKVSQSQREHWGRELGHYFHAREPLRGLLLVLDIRRGLTPLDRQMIELLAARATPLHCLLNKADKLGRGEARRTLRTVQEALAGSGVTAGAQLFSATRREGLDECRAVLARWLALPTASA